jgi:hypothetical protein
MTRKALTLAGRHLVLLAILMVTAIFGLLFSGWLTPATGRAQTGADNPLSGNENTNCCPGCETGPRYGSWQVDSCPKVTNSWGVNPSSFCGEVGEAPCTPTLTRPIYDTGKKHRSISWDCTNYPDTDTGNISFAVGEVYWEPNLPAKFTKSESKTYYARVDVTSSDPDLCASPGQFTLGEATYNVVDPDPESPSTEIDVKSIIDTYYEGPAAAIAALQAVVPNCSFSKPEPSGKITYTTPKKCCDCQNNDVRSTKKAKGSVGLEIPEVSCAIPGLGYKYKDWFYIGVSGFCSGSIAVGVTYQKNPCDNNQPQICVIGSADGTLGFRAGGAVNITACTVDIHGDVSASGNVSLTACTGTPADGTFTINPLTLSGTCTVKTLFLTCEKKFPSIELSPKIEIPIHIAAISI